MAQCILFVACDICYILRFVDFTGTASARDWLVCSRKGYDSGYLSEQLNTLFNLFPFPIFVCDCLHVGEDVKDCKCHKKDIIGFRG